MVRAPVEVALVAQNPVHDITVGERRESVPDDYSLVFFRRLLGPRFEVLCDDTKARAPVWNHPGVAKPGDGRSIHNCFTLLCRISSGRRLCSALVSEEYCPCFPTRPPRSC